MVHDPNELAISITGLGKRYGDFQVLENLDLAVAKGCIHGLVGLNGSGKTTTLDCLLGLQYFDQGSIQLLGYEPGQLHQAAGKVVSIFDTPSLNPNLTVRQTLNHSAMLSNTPHRSAEQLEHLLGIEKFSNFKIKNLSLGNKRRTSIAYALSGAPELIVLDEPFNGLDAAGVDDVLALIKQLNTDDDTTFLLSSHQLPYLEQICSHLSVLHQGSIAVSDTIDGLLAGRNPVAQLRVIDSKDEHISNLINSIAGATVVKTDSDFIHVELDALEPAILNRNLIEQGVAISELRLERASLSSLFREITAGVNP